MNGAPLSFPESPSSAISNSTAVDLQKTSGDQPRSFGEVATRNAVLRWSEIRRG